MNSIYLALDSLFIRYVNLFKDDANCLPIVEFDPPWPSPCQIENNGEEPQTKSYWKPLARKEENIFKQLEEGFEFAFPEEIKAYYGSFWSNGICVEHKNLAFNLIQIWNEEDQEQLKENMLGHVFAKLKNKQAVSYFIGCTDGNDIVIYDHETGAIQLEKPGYKAHETLADTLEEFLLNLIPQKDEY